MLTKNSGEEEEGLRCVETKRKKLSITEAVESEKIYPTTNYNNVKSKCKFFQNV